MTKERHDYQQWHESQLDGSAFALLNRADVTHETKSMPWMRLGGFALAGLGLVAALLLYLGR